MAEHLLTIEDIKELEAKLEDLKVNGRAEMAERIRVAREFGDLSENAEYDIAKEEQAKLEAQIIEIEQILQNAVIYEKTKSDKVMVGNIVDLELLATKENIRFELVGSHQVDPFKNKISVDSPIGKELMGRKKGEVIYIKTKKGQIKYKILKIS